MFRIFKKTKSFLAAIGKMFLAVIHFITATPVYQKVAMFVTALFTSANIWATSTGAGGFTRATTEISSYQTPVANLMKAIAAVIVLVGAFNVYFKMQNGDQDVKKTIILFTNKCKFINLEIFKNILYLIVIQHFKIFLNKINVHYNLNLFSVI